LVGTAVGVGSYRALADVDFEAIEEAVEEAVEEAEREVTIGESGSVDVSLESTDEDVTEESADLDATDEPPAHPRRRTEVLASAVEHAMGFRRTDEEPSD
jgi:cytoskeletal protein RodZ